MGNVLEQESIKAEDADTTEDDLKWLAVSAVHTQRYVLQWYDMVGMVWWCGPLIKKKPTRNSA